MLKFLVSALCFLPLIAAFITIMGLFLIGMSDEDL